MAQQLPAQGRQEACGEQCTSEGVDGLSIVTNHRDAAALALQQVNELRLHTPPVSAETHRRCTVDSGACTARHLQPGSAYSYLVYGVSQRAG